MAILAWRPGRVAVGYLAAVAITSVIFFAVPILQFKVVASWSYSTAFAYFYPWYPATFIPWQPSLVSFLMLFFSNFLYSIIPF
ncbi:MAG TPA: hypothetical protein VGG57_04035, partial [Stellaceae bacterium]